MLPRRPMGRRCGVGGARAIHAPPPCGTLGGVPRRAAPFSLVPDLEAFFGPPARRYVVRRTFSYWQLERRVFGIVIWGRPDESDAEEIAAAHEVGANPMFRGHTSLVDVRGLEAVDLLSFQKLLALLKERRDAWSPNVSKQAVLHGGGLAHAAVAGLFQFLAPAHPVSFFEDARAAYEAIGAGEVADEVEALRSDLLAVPEAVRRVRATLATMPREASPSAVAKQLGMSVRSLQRHLAEHGTSLRAERQIRLVRAAEELLVGTEMTIDAIAAATGASSASHLVTMFRTHRGTTPAAFRAERRARG